MLDVQQKIVQACEAIDQEVVKAQENITRLRSEIDAMVQEVINNTEQHVVILGDVADIHSGGTPNTKVEKYWKDGTIHWATLADTKEKYVSNTQKKITKEGLENSSATLLPINTVLFSSRATIGDVAIAKVETCTNQGYKNFVCNEDELYYEFLYYLLKAYTPRIKELASGMTYPEISKIDLSNLSIPLPPLQE